MINSEINTKYIYNSDIKLYDKINHYATLKEFEKNNGGDCEDFAVAKYYTLTSAGVPSSTLSFVILRTKYPQAHMVLKYKSGDVILYLDLDSVTKFKSDWSIIGEYPISIIEELISRHSRK